VDDREFLADSATLARNLLKAAEIDGEVSLRPLPAGGNNRLFRVDCGESYVLKRYFRHPLDPRNRFSAETRFSSFLWRNGIRNVPEPIAGDPIMSVALFGFVEGEKIGRDGIDGEHVAQALDFLEEINRHRGEEFAAGLAAASEACFSVTDHLELLDARIARLARIGGSAEPFSRDVLSIRWPKIRAAAMKRAGSDAGRVLFAHERCLSPSDFGFHNALRRPDGRLAFLDFEYAGWDDPAKLVCDFFCQVECPVPFEHFEDFMNRIAPWFGDPARVIARCRLLLPVYRAKWACIVLNALTPVGLERRRFSGRGSPSDSEIAERLDRANALLANAAEGI